MAFCDEMQRLLPREIREMIYEELWSANGGATAPVNKSWSHLCDLVKEDCYCKFGTLEECMGHKAAPHFIKQSYVGIETAREALEMWYKMVPGGSNYRHLFATTLSEANRLLTADAFKVGLKPTAVLRGLIVEVPVKDLVASPAEAQAMVDQLLRIVHKRDFHLYIRLPQRNIRLNLWTPIFELLRPVLTAFKEHSRNIRVQWFYQPDRTSTIKYDLNPHIRDPGAEWKEYLIESFFKPRQQCLQVRHRDYLVEDNPDYDPQHHEDTTNRMNNCFGNDPETDSEDGSDTGSDDGSTTGPDEESPYCSSDESYDSD